MPEQLARTPAEREALFRQIDKHRAEAAELWAEANDYDTCGEDDEELEAQVGALRYHAWLEEQEIERLMRRFPEVFYSLPMTSDQ